MVFDKVGEHTAPIGNWGERVTVNDYNKATGVYKLSGIQDDTENVDIVGGFVSKAKDEYFSVAPDYYSY